MGSPIHLRPSSIVLALITAASVHAQQVLTVGGGGAFTTLQAAVAAATNGDTVLVKSGDYAGATVTRPMSIIADGPNVTLNSQLRIDGIPAGSTVLVHGFGDSAFASLSRVRVTNCAGSVFIEDCSFDQIPFLGHGIQIETSSGVTISRCELGGGPSNTGPGAGIHAVQSTVYVYDCDVTGGVEFTSSDVPPGIYAESSFVYLHGSIVTGGRGGTPSVHCQFTPSGDGGPAIEAIGTSQVIALATTFVGGPPGGNCPGGPIGSQGLPTAISASATLTGIPGSAHTLSADAVVREGNPLVYTVTGDPGDIAAIGFALSTSPTYLPFLNGPLLLDPSFVTIPIGALPASGVLSIQTVVPTLPTDVQRYYVQLFAINPSLVTVYAGSAQALTLLRTGF